MSDNHRNLFVSLHKWARNQDENFTTEALAILLQHLCSRDQNAAIRVITKMTKGQTQISHDELHELQIFTQNRSPFGIPDLELQTKTTFVIFEVKVTDTKPIERTKLERYRSILHASGRRQRLCCSLRNFPPT
jgi:hypothetical protein